MSGTKRRKYKRQPYREFGCKPYRLHDACLNETGMDIRKVIMEGAGA